MNENCYIANRPVPDGYTEHWDFTAWNVGFVYRWSEFYKAWMDENVVLTVKPGQTLWEAFEARMDQPMGLDYTIFFSEDN